MKITFFSLRVKASLLLLACALSISEAKAQCILKKGDIAFVGYDLIDDQNSGNESANGLDDQFSFVILRDIPAATEIFFTDLGWTNQNAFQTPAKAQTDGVIKWKADINYNAGTVVTINCKFLLTADKGTVSGILENYETLVEYPSFPNEYMSLSELSGDQIFAYTGDYANNPTLLAGISINTPTGWDGTFYDYITSSSQSMLPEVLSTGAQNLQIIRTDPSDPSMGTALTGRLKSLGALSGTASVLISVVNGLGNWELNPEAIYDYAFTPLAAPNTYTVSAPTINTQPQNALNVCPVAATSFTVVADATACDYQWQTYNTTTSVWEDISNTDNTDVYTNTKTATLNISNVAGLDGKKYRVIVYGARPVTSNEASISLVPLLSVSTAPALTSGIYNVSYSTNLAATGGKASYIYGVNAGSTLPGGLTLAPSGTLSGTPTVSGSFSFTLKLTDGCLSAATKTFTLDIAPAVTSVDVPVSGTYKAGGSLSFTVKYSGAVNVTGNPVLNLTIGSASRNAAYAGGDGSSSLIFTYTVLPGDEDTDGIVINALSLNHGTIKSGTLNAVNTLNNVASSANVKVDGIVPSIASVNSATANGSYNSGDLISLTIDFSEPVYVTGTPTLALNTAATAAYSSGSGTSKLTFDYTVGSSENTPDLDYTATNSLLLAGGSIRDENGNDATLTLPVPGANNSLGFNSDLVVDNVKPAVPGSLSATAGNTQVTLNWASNSDSDLTSYNVYGGTSSNPTTLLQTVAKPGIAFTHTGLTNGTTYYYSITALDLAGNESLASSDVSAVPVNSQVITFNAIGTKIYGDADFDPGATSTNTGASIIYSSSDNTVATIVSNKVHIVKVGTVTIYADQPASASFSAAIQKSQSFTVSPKSITGSFTASDKTYDGTNAATITGRTVTPVASDAGNLSLTGGTATFSDANKGTGKTVTATGMTLSGSAAGNYTLTGVNTTTADITALDITGSFTASDKTYDGTNAAIITGRTVTPVASDAGNLSLTGGTATFSDANKGTGKTVTATGMTLSGSAAGNYTLTSVNTTTADITALDITGSFTASDKTYDGTNAATITGRTVSPVASDAGNLSLTGGTATFSDANKGTGKIVTVTGMILSGSAAGNYNLTGVTTTTADITALDIAGSFTASSKTYDGTNAATITGRTVSPLASDAGNLSLTGGTATFSDANKGTGKTVAATGMTLSGSAAENYHLTGVTTTTADITALDITGSFTASNKTYDGTNAATITGRTVTPVASDAGSLILTGGMATFSDANKGTGKTVTATGMTLSGSAAGNYTLTGVNTTTANITALDITGRFTASNKTYDGTNAVTITGRTVTPVASDAGNLSLTGGSATFSDANKGTGKTVTATGMTLSGNAAGNYTLTGVTTATANITALDIVGSFTASDKTYDGTNAATIISSIVIPLASDVGSLSLTGGTATFSDANKGTGKTVTATGMTLSGIAAGNYNLTGVTTATADITALAIVGSFTASDKAYDGTAAATITSRTVSPLASDAGNLTLTGGTATFSDANKGTGKTVTATGMILSGSAASNYNLTGVTTTTADITALDIAGSFTASSKTYDGTNAATITGRTVSPLASDVGNLILTGGTATFSDANKGTDKTVTATGMTLSGSAAGNYNLTGVNTTTADITALGITGSFTASDKTYDGTNKAIIIGRTVTPVASDAGNLSLKGGSATFSNANKGTSKTITATGMTLSGSAAGNYNLTGVNTTTADITALDIAGSFTASDKTYDGTNEATITGRTVTPVASDAGNLSLTGGTATFSDANKGTGKTVAATGMILSGSAAGNYHLTGVITTTADIAAKEVTVSAQAIGKVYGQSDPALTYTVSPALVAGDIFTGSIHRQIGENAGTYVIDINTLALGSNYLIKFEPGEFTITKKPLTITANDKEKFVGTPNPLFTVTYDGFVAGEGHSSLNAQPVIMSTADKASAIGNYAITVSGAASQNYDISYIAGNLKIKAGAPTSIDLAAVMLYENRPSGSLVGTLSSTSDDEEAIFSYSLVGGDSRSFAIVGDQLLTTASLNFEQKSSYRIMVRSTTQYGFSLDKEFTVAINDVNETPTLTAIANQTICYSTSKKAIALSGISAGEDAGQTTALTVSADNIDLFESLTVTGSEVRYRVKNGASGTATVIVTVTDNGGTFNGGIDHFSREFTVNVNALPVAAIVSDLGTTIAKGQIARLTATGGTTYCWTDASGIINGQNTSVLTVRPSQTTTYRVTVTNTNGCSDEHEITLLVEDDFRVLDANNIMSPNGDGINDKLEIKNLDMYPNNTVQIYDRAGRLIYSQKNYTDQWDGTFQGSPLAEDTYFYVVDFGAGKGKIKGFVTIVRE